MPRSAVRVPQGDRRVPEDEERGGRVPAIGGLFRAAEDGARVAARAGGSREELPEVRRGEDGEEQARGARQGEARREEDEVKFALLALLLSTAALAAPDRHVT